jgi:hypothetical protein
MSDGESYFDVWFSTSALVKCFTIVGIGVQSVITGTNEFNGWTKCRSCNTLSCVLRPRYSCAGCGRIKASH